MGLTLLAYASVPLKFWDEAFSTAIYLINRLPSKVINDETPFERLLGQKPDYNSLRTFGCAVWPNLWPYNSRKLQFRSKQCVFIGYSTLHKGYKCLDPQQGRVYVSRDVVFDEHVFPFASLHPNAGAWLWKELELLPDILLNPSTSPGGTTLHDHDMHSPASTNVSPRSGAIVIETGENAEQNHQVMESGELYFMCSPLGGSGSHKVDPSPVDLAASGGSSSGSGAHQPSTAPRSLVSPTRVGGQHLGAGSSTALPMPHASATPVSSAQTGPGEVEIASPIPTVISSSGSSAATSAASPAATTTLPAPQRPTTHL